MGFYFPRVVVNWDIIVLEAQHEIPLCFHQYQYEMLTTIHLEVDILY